MTVTRRNLNPPTAEDRARIASSGRCIDDALLKWTNRNAPLQISLCELGPSLQGRVPTRAEMQVLRERYRALRVTQQRHGGMIVLQFAAKS